MFWKYLYVVELRHFHLKNEFSSKYNKYIIQQNILIYNVNPFLHAKKEFQYNYHIWYMFSLNDTTSLCFSLILKVCYKYKYL